jgi:hypothetical protein
VLAGGRVLAGGAAWGPAAVFIAAVADFLGEDLAVVSQVAADLGAGLGALGLLAAWLYPPGAAPGGAALGGAALGGAALGGAAFAARAVGSGLPGPAPAAPAVT